MRTVHRYVTNQWHSLTQILRRLLERLNPVQTITMGYVSYILLIGLLLCLPLTWRLEHIAFLDHLFMATSAVSTTGLVTINTPDAYNFWGQLVLLVGFQIGGLGYMTFGSFAIMASRGRVSESRIAIGKAVFLMPEHFEPASFIRRAVLFSVILETIGAACLYFAFARAGVQAPLWPAVFHSVSAFCTAGFSVFPNSLESFHDDVLVNVIVASLSLVGAIGFIVMSDFWFAMRTRTHAITLTSKIILAATVGGISIGTALLYLDPSIAGLPFANRLLVAWFQAMSASTTVGFNTHPVAVLSHASILIILVLMILGASPSGTGGGLKSTSWSAGLAATWSAIRGRKETTFFGHTVPNYRIQAAFASFTLYLMIFALGCYLLLLADRHPFEDVVFEVASSLGTVGLSRGITSELTALGKWVVIALMFIGRVGVISIGLTVLSQKISTGEQPKDGDLIV